MSNDIKGKVTKGFLKRIWGSYRTRKYENKVKMNEKFLKDWEKMKWKIRTMKIVFYCGFVSIGYFLFIRPYTNKIANHNLEEYSLLSEKMENLFTDLTKNKSALKFDDFFNELEKANSLYFKIKLENNNTIDNNFMNKVFSVLSNYIKDLSSIKLSLISLAIKPMYYDMDEDDQVKQRIK